MSFDGNTSNSNVNLLNHNILTEFYKRSYPSADDLLLDVDNFEEEELQELLHELRTEVGALKEETEIFQLSAEVIRGEGNQNNNNNNNNVNKLLSTALNDTSASSGLGHYHHGSPTNNNNDSSSATPLRAGSAALSQDASSTTTPVKNKRGQQYRRKSLGDADASNYVSLEDKMGLLLAREKLLKEYEASVKKQQDEYKAVLAATVGESKKRMKELKLEVQEFQREVLSTTDDESGDETKIYAEEIERFLQLRLKRQAQYMDKLKDQFSIAERNIKQVQTVARQRQEAGEAFHLVDLEQLSIENEQLNERIVKKNSELAQLKSISTRTVQALNGLTNALNDVLQEQTKLKKEVKSRKDYLARCQEEIIVVTREGEKMEMKNTIIKSQHEAVRVPKIEDYIAQKAELFELEKTVKNWERKVEISKGQVKVMKQKMKALREQEAAAMSYAENRRRQSRKAINNTKNGGYTVHQNPSTFSKNNNNKSQNNNNANLFINSNPIVHSSSPIPMDNNNNNNQAPTLDQSNSAVVGVHAVC
ncbi:hypothetical protein AGDE_11244 [Angomonas deanei]|uniref:Cilia- and flagella-associated protein 263 n=1 Tax=Angomonas deanei TaxID=59799 RepID=A0A7G2CHT0_9TRYP|nr:hypothetical protein AGDE_11244 [Angomonas deanei]CAD2219306.1 Domain of unknown function (DUF4201), putative [Angomonas deanei]|eukprot:EPY26517.1 hypothetical protein AGDE_11244 [Angomonas deanei]